MELDEIRMLADTSPAWRLLRARNAPLVLAFLVRLFVEQNEGARPQAALTEAGGPICDSFVRDRDLNRKKGVPGYRFKKQKGRVKCVASGDSLGISTTCAKEIGMFSLCYCEG